MTKTLRQMLRYAIVALIGLLIDFGVLIFMTEFLGLYYLLGVCGGFIIGLGCTYLLSNSLVFGRPKNSAKAAFILFGIIGVVGLGILNLLVWALTSGIGLNYLISKSIATIAVFMWNFFARKALYHEEDTTN